MKSLADDDSELEEDAAVRAVALTGLPKLLLVMLQDAHLSRWVVLLLVYVGLGSVALRPDRSKAVRTAAYVISLAVVVSIIIIAKTKPAWPLA